MVHLSEETVFVEKVKFNGSHYQKYTINGTLNVKNISGKDMEIHVGKAIIGVPVSASEKSTLSSIPHWNRSLNPDGKIQWTMTLKPNEKRELTYQYTYLD